MPKKIVFNAPIVIMFVFISCIVYIVNTLTIGYANREFFSVYMTSYSDPMLYIRLIGHVLGHSDWAHYTRNMVLILLVGPLLEEKYGSKKMMFIIFITAIVTGLVFINTSSNALLGASGVCYAFVMLSSITSARGKSIPLTMILISIIFLSNEFISGSIVKSNISNLTHLVGAVVGIVLGFIYKK